MNFPLSPKRENEGRSMAHLNTNAKIPAERRPASEQLRSLMTAQSYTYNASAQTDQGTPAQYAFLKSLHEMLADASDSEGSGISWLPSGVGFIITQKQCFIEKTFPRFFGQAKFTSFTRRLKRWGFKRVVEDIGAYYYRPGFCRDMILNRPIIRSLTFDKTAKTSTLSSDSIEGSGVSSSLPSNDRSACAITLPIKKRSRYDPSFSDYLRKANTLSNLPSSRVFEPSLNEQASETWKHVSCGDIYLMPEILRTINRKRRRGHADNFGNPAHFELVDRRLNASLPQEKNETRFVPVPVQRMTSSKIRPSSANALELATSDSTQNRPAYRTYPKQPEYDAMSLPWASQKANSLRHYLQPTIRPLSQVDEDRRELKNLKWTDVLAQPSTMPQSNSSKRDENVCSSTLPWKYTIAPKSQRLQTSGNPETRHHDLNIYKIHKDLASCDVDWRVPLPLPQKPRKPAFNRAA